MSVEQRPRTVGEAPPSLRASDRDRDQVLVLLHTAFAEGRLTEVELDERSDAVLAARTHEELGRMSADLPARTGAPAAPAVGAAGRFQMAYKSRIRRSGRWRLPKKFTSVVYKGESLLDLRAAELDGPLTTIRVVAYKSTVEILVPPGTRVEIGGVGVSAEIEGAEPDGSPVVRIKGIAYKGAIDAKDHIYRR
ncbi:DUF1707 SHOCT-like domain-containing protein [Spirillospora sp. NBC_01491]|uniref:DUF1707 SHOCT-like domain-containing protein n=1 Tax=Spirillospora sp. NBC_01491 TaxID=2976007 RepID=UPI002E3387E1|nr:DUF1707 domain-containing protein [Spirillospora sp. NBC_01491]